ncbi:3-oxoadipate enol-lactonase [Ilyonectria sp. MPI-CAGE-AT-0026]|nr:3-oxoadipate enol-lactonase [Ilyonectria sp. MPI-CAGE-AT-0026]
MSQPVHEWYNNEHGPVRLRLPEIFTNGLRYRASDGQTTAYMAVYDLTSTSWLSKPTYTRLRDDASAYEVETMGQVDVKRYFYDLLWESSHPEFVPFETLTDQEAEGLMVLSNQLTFKGDEEAAKYLKWYKEEHGGLLRKVPGWSRTRLFKSSPKGPNGQETYLAYNEFAKQNGLGGTEHQRSISTQWTRDIATNCIKDETRRKYSLFYVFGTGPRDLQSLAQLHASRELSDEGSSIVKQPSSGQEGVISSFIKAPDGLRIPYRLEGNADPKAPVVVFSNSLLTSLHMWDPFVAILKAERPELCILRYDSRGRSDIPRLGHVQLEALAADIQTLLHGLHVSNLHALIGVSIGGATALKTAIEYPDMVSKIIVCDVNCASPSDGAKPWKERIAIAEADGGRGIRRLAAETVTRWFHPSSSKNESLVTWMTDMAADNSVDGFKYSCAALWDYDLTSQLASIRGPTLLVAGSHDANGAVSKAMHGFKNHFTEKGAKLQVVDGTSHLPMCENPQAFWEAVRDFL